MPARRDERRAKEAAELDRRIAAQYAKGGGMTKVAKRFGLTLKFVKASLERSGVSLEIETPTVLEFPVKLVVVEPKVAPTPEPEPRAVVRDLADEPIDRTEVEGWLELRRYGWHDADIAAEAGVDAHKVAQLCSVVSQAMRREADAEPAQPKPPRLRPLFPIGAFTPKSECPHRGPLKRGSKLCCMVCHKSGLDGRHPALVRDPKKDPQPEKKVPDHPRKPETRAQKRARLQTELMERLRRRGR